MTVPARHPLLAHKRIPLEELLRYPLVLCDPQVCEGHAKFVDRVLHRADMEPLVAERVATCDLMMALVSAGLALGFTGAARIAANRRGFAYTHYSALEPWNAHAIARANAQGFVINLSANNLQHADELARLKVGPVVTLLPPEQTMPTTTPDGRYVAICPASVRGDVSCASCGICATVQRRAIIGFPAHGSSKAKAHRVFYMAQAAA